MSEIKILPAELPIKCYKGDTLNKTFTFKDGNGDELDLSSCVVTMQVRKKAGSPALIDLSEGNGLTVSGGNVTVTHTVAIDKGSYLWDIQFKYSTITRTYLAGDFIVPNDITRP